MCIWMCIWILVINSYLGVLNEYYFTCLFLMSIIGTLSLYSYPLLKSKHIPVFVFVTR